MAREIKTSLIVDGEQKFKREINDAKTSIRNLGTQLSLAAAEFKKDGDAMKLMQSRAKALKDEISQQKNIVKALEGAVREATEKYGKGSKEAEKWEAELNRAKTTMTNLERELENNSRGLDKNGKAFDSATEKAGTFSGAVNDIAKGVSFQTITSGVEKISAGFDRAISKAAQLAGKMWDMMRDAASWADDEITLAKVYGVSTEDLQRMQYAAKMTDTDVDVIIRARQRLAVAMKNAGNGEYKEAFQAVRVPTVDDRTGQRRSMDNVFWDIGRALMEMPDEKEVERDTAALKLFGRSWMELKPLFSTGRTKYESLLGDAPIVSDDSLDKLGELQDELDKMDSEIQALKMNGLAELAPGFQTVAEAVSDLMGRFNEYIQTDEGKQLMEELNQAITDLFGGLKDVDFQSAVDTVRGGLEGVRDAFTWIRDNAGGVQNALLVIGAAMAAMKVGTFALHIGQAVHGFRGLFGIGKGGSPTTTPTGGGDVAKTAGGGTATAISNFVTGLIARGTSALTALGGMGGLPGVTGDIFLNQTNAGRALQYGGDVFEGLKQDLTEAGDGIKKNAETFGDDLRENVFLGSILDTMTGGLWSLIFRKKPEEPEKKEEEAAAGSMPLNTELLNAVKEQTESSQDVSDMLHTLLDGASPTDTLDRWKINQMYNLPGGGGSGGGGETNKAMIAGIKNLPGSTGEAIRRVLSGTKVEIDGRTAGRILAPFVGEYMARDVQG